MQKVVFTNSRGESVELYRRPFFLTKIEGLGDVSAEIQTQKAPGQDGATYIDAVLDQRYIPMEVDIIDDSKVNRQVLTRVFNPKLGLGTLTYTNGLVTYEIKAIPEHVPTFDDVRPIITQKVMIDLVCPNPLWQSMNEEQYKLEDYVSNFHFPFSFPVVFAIRGDQITLENNGDVSTPVQVEFRGPVKNPRITNMTTGKYIQVNREIPEGYKLLLDTSFDNKTVDIVGPDGVVSRAFHYIDLNSEFFDLIVGENQLSFITDGGEPEVYIKYKHLYLGV